MAINYTGTGWNSGDKTFFNLNDAVNYSKKKQTSSGTDSSYNPNLKVTNIYSDAKWDPNTRTINAGGRTLKEGTEFKINPTDNRAYYIPALDTTPDNNNDGNAPKTPKIKNTPDYNFPYEKMLRDMMSAPSAFQPQNDAQRMAAAESRATLQLGSLLSALQSRRSQEEAQYGSQKGDIEAAYANIPATTQRLLEEAKRSAMESAIARGMGRSGVADWQTAKLSSPIMEQQAQAEAEKAAKLAGLANNYNSTISDLTRQESDISGRRGTLIDDLVNEMLRNDTNMALQQEASKWGQGMGLANMAQNTNNAQQNFMSSLLPLLLYG